LVTLPLGWLLDMGTWLLMLSRLDTFGKHLPCNVGYAPTGVENNAKLAFDLRHSKEADHVAPRN
jgi:hypothetical protein